MLFSYCDPLAEVHQVCTAPAESVVKALPRVGFVDVRMLVQPPGILKVQDVAPGSEEPVVHVVQVVEDVAPVAVLNFPTGQRVQLAVPGAAAYVPAGQAAHAPPGGLVCPAGHAVQPATDVAPATPLPKPAGHGQHDAGGMEYIAAGHVVTVYAHIADALGLYAPVEQAVQLASRNEAADDMVPAGQGKRVATSFGQ